MSYEPKVYKEQGGDTLVIRAGDGGVIKGQAAAGGTPVQTAAIVTLTDSTGGTPGNTVDDATTSVKDDIASLAAKINAILVALRNVGIIVA